MKTIKHILPILIFFTLFSCKKEDKHTHVSGKVVDGETGASITNASIMLRDDNEGLQIANTTSDINGNYNFDIPGEHSALSFQVSYSDYYSSPLGKDFQISLDNTLEKRNFNLNIYPPAYVKLIAVKTETIYDFVTFIYSEYTPNGSAGITVYNSMPTNYSYKKMKGGYTTAFNYNIQKFLTGNPIEYSSGTANIYCTPRDTTDFYLTY